MDECFESGDGDAVAVALLRKADGDAVFAQALCDWYCPGAALRDIWPDMRAKWAHVETEKLGEMSARLLRGADMRIEQTEMVLA